VSLEEITTKIEDGRGSRRPTLIAIDGYGGSGKTTFANRLAELLSNAYVVHMDDFIVKDKLTETSWDKGSFDRPRLEKQILQPVREGKIAKFQRLMWKDDVLSSFITVPKVQYLLVEGISSYHPDIASYYNFKIWIDTPIKIAKERGRARDDANENAIHWELWAQNDLWYQQKHHPETSADFVFSNN
jgi:uridine kinase